MSHSMNRAEREEFLAGLHVGVLSVDGGDATPPLTQPDPAPTIPDPQPAPPPQLQSQPAQSPDPTTQPAEPPAPPRTRAAGAHWMIEHLDQGPGYTREVLRRRTAADPLPEPAE